MLSFFNKKIQKKLNKSILKKNNISLLYLDDRWEKLFTQTVKPLDIQRKEGKLKELVKEQTKLIYDLDKLNTKKRVCMDKIITLTSDVFEKEDSNAKDAMAENRRNIRVINMQLCQMESRLDELPDIIQQKNLELIESAIESVYSTIKTDIKRIKKLEEITTEMKLKLRLYVDEMYKLKEKNSGVYCCFHNLLGSEQLHNLDLELFDMDDELSMMSEYGGEEE